jgi:hypothetical protein
MEFWFEDPTGLQLKPENVYMHAVEYSLFKTN